MAFALFVNIAGFMLPMAGTPPASTVSAGLSVRLATVPAAPTVSMVVRRDSEHEKVAEMPAELAQWGCDEEMWTNLRASARKSLRRLATRGDQKGNALEVISNLRAALLRDAGASSAPAVGQTKVVRVDPVAAVPAAKAVAVAVEAEAKATAAAAAAEAAEVMEQAEATVAKVNKEAAAKALVDAKKAAEEKKAAEAKAAEAKALVEKVKEEVEEKAEEEVKEEVEEEAPSAQPEVEVDTFNTAWPEVEAVGALAPNGFSWGPTF